MLEINNYCPFSGTVCKLYCCSCSVTKYVMVFDRLQFFPSTDINECEADEVPCDGNAQCVNVDGSFNCTCNEGFGGDGFTCVGKLITCVDA